MKKIGIAVVMVGVVIIAVVLLVKKNKPIQQPVQVAASPTVIPTVVPTQSEYSAEVKAKVRSDFINNCNIKGHYSISACNCAADYLSKNYSEAELAKIYIQYHTTNRVPSQLEMAVKACVKK